MAQGNEEPTVEEIERRMRACIGPDGEDLALRRWTDGLTPEERRLSEENLRRFVSMARSRLRRDPRG